MSAHTLFFYNSKFIIYLNIIFCSRFQDNLSSFLLQNKSTIFTFILKVYIPNVYVPNVYSSGSQRRRLFFCVAFSCGHLRRVRSGQKAQDRCQVVRRKKLQVKDLKKKEHKVMGGHVSTTSLSDSERRKSIGTALFSRILRDAGVENLHSLDERWRKNLIPKESEEGRKLCSDLEEYDTVFASRKRMSKQMIDSFLELESRLRIFFQNRIQMYEEALKDKKASAQLQN